MSALLDHNQAKLYHEAQISQLKMCILIYLTTLFILPVIYWRKGRITSSRHDPYGLGYTRVTMVVTKGGNDASRSESLKTTQVQIVLCNSRT